MNCSYFGFVLIPKPFLPHSNCRSSRIAPNSAPSAVPLPPALFTFVPDLPTVVFLRVSRWQRGLVVAGENMVPEPQVQVQEAGEGEGDGRAESTQPGKPLCVRLGAASARKVMPLIREMGRKIGDGACCCCLVGN